jgi:hypothetical protein
VTTGEAFRASVGYSPDGQTRIVVSDDSGDLADSGVTWQPTVVVPAASSARALKIRIESSADVSCTWLAGSGNGHGPSRLLAALRDLELPAGPGYVWFAGEAAESRAVRTYVRRELGWPTERCTVLGYWRVDKERWMARYEQVGESLEKVYESAVASGLSQADALDAYEEALEKAGL